MSTQLSAQDVFNLSKSFHDLSVAIGNFRYENWSNLSAAQKSDLESKQWTLFNTASDLNGKSVVLKMKLLDEDMKTLKACTKSMQKSAEKIADVKAAISIAAKAIALGGAIYMAATTGNVGIVIAAATSLAAELDK